MKETSWYGGVFSSSYFSSPPPGHCLLFFPSSPLSSFSFCLKSPPALPPPLDRSLSYSHHVYPSWALRKISFHWRGNSRRGKEEREGKECEKRKEGKDGEKKRGRNCNCEESPIPLVGPHLQYRKAGSA